MIVAEPLGSAEDKSLELELARNIHNLARGGAAFRRDTSFLDARFECFEHRTPLLLLCVDKRINLGR